MAAAELGTRKQFIEWKGSPLFWHSATTMARVPAIRGIVFVFPPEEHEDARSLTKNLDTGGRLGIPWVAVQGGERRQDSVRLGLGALPPDAEGVLVHDAARPFASAPLVSSLCEALEHSAAIIPAIPVTDTIKSVQWEGAEKTVEATLVRNKLRAVQTPQAFRLDVLRPAHEQALTDGWDVTDDASMVERLDVPVTVIPGEETNVKITTPEDLSLISGSVPTLLPCVGWGYDVHRYGEGRPFVLGGVPIPKAPQVIAHSDGDVLLHALTDALLGCLGKGDIGRHFPDTDPRYDNIESSILLNEVFLESRKAGLLLTHVDLTVVAQRPKLAAHREDIRRNVASLLHMNIADVNFKATTEEHLGFTGRKEGIKAVAAVTALKPAGTSAPNAGR